MGSNGQAMGRQVEQIEGVASGLAAVLAGGFDPGDVGEAAALIRCLEVAARRMHAAQAELLAAIDRTGVHREDGHGSAKVMVRHVAQLSAAEATRRAQSVAVLADLPEVASAHRAGEVGVCQVRRLGRVHANARVRDRLPLSEPHMLGWATGWSYRDFDALVAGWERRIDEDGAPDRESRAHAARTFTVVQDYDGSWTCWGSSPSLPGAEVADVLAHFTDLEWQRDWADARTRLGDAATSSDLARSDAQRRHDALVAMCRHAATTAPGVGGGTTTVVTNVVIDHATFERELARLAGRDPGPVDPNDSTWRCSTLDGGPLDPTSVTLQALYGEVRRVVIGADSTVIDLGRRRLFTGAAALAVRLAQGECVWPGCHAPATNCQIDHLRPHAHGGETAPANGAPACGRHNQFKHDHGWQTWRDPDGTWHLRRPDGTTVEGPRARAPAGGRAASSIRTGGLAAG